MSGLAARVERRCVARSSISASPASVKGFDRTSKAHSAPSALQRVCLENPGYDDDRHIRVVMLEVRQRVEATTPF
jgi:hypothetical protein